MVLNFVDYGLGVFYPNSQCKCFCLDFHLFIFQQIKDIPRRMSGCQNQCFTRNFLTAIDLNGLYFAFCDLEIRQFRFKTHFTAKLTDTITHGHNYLRQLVRPDMRMCIYNNIFMRPKMNKPFQSSHHVSPLLGTGI
ncbi:hypothetical protein D3C86_1643670 [compost metagenome]